MLFNKFDKEFKPTAIARNNIIIATFDLLTHMSSFIIIINEITRDIILRIFGFTFSPCYIFLNNFFY